MQIGKSWSEDRERPTIWLFLRGINAEFLTYCCGGLEMNFLEQCFYEFLWGLDWLKEWMLHLQRTPVQLSAPISGHQLPITLAQEHVMSLASSDTCIHMYQGTHIYTHTQTHLNNRRKHCSLERGCFTTHQIYVAHHGIIQKKAAEHLSLDHWFSTFQMLRPFHIDLHVMVTPNHNSILVAIS